VARRVIHAVFVGTTVRWSAFLLYRTAAAIVFNGNLLPNFHELAGTIAAFGALL
jgi:hypothetical protein